MVTRYTNGCRCCDSSLVSLQLRQVVSFDKVNRLWNIGCLIYAMKSSESKKLTLKTNCHCQCLHFWYFDQNHQSVRTVLSSFFPLLYLHADLSSYSVTVAVKHFYHVSWFWLLSVHHYRERKTLAVWFTLPASLLMLSNQIGRAKRRLNLCIH